MINFIESITNPLKAAGETAQKLIGLRDTAKFGDALIELQDQIIAAQQGALEAQGRELAMSEEIHELKERVAEMEIWDAEKERYELKEVVPGQFVYAVREEVRGSEPPHMLCANCYNHDQKSILQTEIRNPGHHEVLFCQRCGGDLFSPSTGGRGTENPPKAVKGGAWAPARRGQ